MDYREEIEVVVDWLRDAQDGGRERGFPSIWSASNGWNEADPVTTARMIPIVLDAHKATSDVTLFSSAIMAMDWILSMDMEKAGPRDRAALALALCETYRRSQAEKYLAAAGRAAASLASMLESSDEAISSAYVAAALHDCGRSLNNADYSSAATSALDRILAQGRAEDDTPDLVDRLDAFLAVGTELGREDYLAAALEGGKTLAIEPLSEKPSTKGIAKTAALSLKLYEINRDPTFSDAGRAAIEHLAAICLRGEYALEGGIPLSDGTTGCGLLETGYYLDALARAHKLKLPAAR